jgi:hypothetical protein
MKVELVSHPDTPADWIERMKCTVRRRAHGLSLSWNLLGDMRDLHRPKAAPDSPARRDGLWRTTCFEAFVKPVGGESYVELNFSPSGDWAAYGFSSYRAGMENTPANAPVITRQGFYWFELTAEIDGLTALPADAPWRVAVSAVIQTCGPDPTRKAEAPGKPDLSYWAIAHPPGKPDFHHTDGFVLELPPTETT